MVVAAVFSVAVGVAACLVALLVVSIAAIVLTAALVLSLVFVIALLIAVSVLAAVAVAGPIVLFVLTVVFLGSALLGAALRPPRKRSGAVIPAPERRTVLEGSGREEVGRLRPAALAHFPVETVEPEPASDVELQHV